MQIKRRLDPRPAIADSSFARWQPVARRLPQTVLLFRCRTPCPAFVKHSSSTHQLQGPSPAVDFTDCCTSAYLDGRNRGIALFRPTAKFDIGAYELRFADAIFTSGFGGPHTGGH